MKEWIVGRNPVYEVLRAGRRQIFQLRLAQGTQESGYLSDILHQCSVQNVQIEQVSRSHLDVFGDTHQGIALETSPFPYSTIHDILDATSLRNEPSLVLILDTLEDPQNLGTLLRTAEVIGVHGVIIPLRRTATVTPAVVSSSSGACEHLLITQANLSQSISTLKEQGLWIIGLDASPEAVFPEHVKLDLPLALVVGNEASGMRQLTKKSCDMLIRLPMRGQIDSLNAAVAGSIALYLAWSARNFKDFKAQTIDG
jgi:23S rRNA (guanosine2251-2'-O)-methyltransferase